MDKKLKSGLVAAAFATTSIIVSACSSGPQVPRELEGCDDLEYEDGIWECEDDDFLKSHGGYYYGGKWYKSKSQIKSSTAYKTALKSGKISTGKKSGFGSSSVKSGG